MAYDAYSVYAPNSLDTSVTSKGLSLPGMDPMSNQLMALLGSSLDFRRQAAMRELALKEQAARLAQAQGQQQMDLEARTAAHQHDAETKNDFQRYVDKQDARAEASKHGGPSFVSMQGGGPQTVSGWVRSGYGPGAVFGGWDPTGGQGTGASFSNQGNSLMPQSLDEFSARNQMEDARVRQANMGSGDPNERADWYGTGSLNRSGQLAALLGNDAALQKKPASAQPSSKSTMY